MKPVSDKDFSSCGVRGAPNGSPLLRDKRRKLVGSDGSVANLQIARTEVRQTDHRNDVRRPLADAQAEVRYQGESYSVALLNVSGGGALIQGRLPANLWDRIELVLGEFGEMECAIRWIDNDRLGLEFAHETQLITDLSTRAHVLREAAALCAEQVESNDVSQTAKTEPAERSPAQTIENREKRHPLLWTGEIWNEQGRIDVRLRNVSARGAMVQASGAVCVGARVILDLGSAGTVRAVVRWAHGDQVGLAFDRDFDVRKLAKCRPQVAPKHWVKPAYLRDEGDTSPWASRWERLTVAELRRTTWR